MGVIHIRQALKPGSGEGGMSETEKVAQLFSFIFIIKMLLFYYLLLTLTTLLALTNYLPTAYLLIVIDQPISMFLARYLLTVGCVSTHLARSRLIGQSVNLTSIDSNLLPCW